MDLKSFLIGHAVGSTRNQTQSENRPRTGPGTGDPGGLRAASVAGAVFFALVGAPFAFLYFCGLTILAPIAGFFGAGFLLCLCLYFGADRICG